MKNKKIIIQGICFFILVVFMGCKDEPDLILITTGNLNGAIFTDSDSTMQSSPLSVVLELAEKERIRVGQEKVLVLSTGDDLFGTFFSDWAFEKDSILIIAELYKLIGYNGIVLGNNDLKYGVDKLQNSIRGKGYNIIGTNIFPNGNLFPNLIYPLNNKSIQVLGITETSICGYLGLNTCCDGYKILPELGLSLDFINRSNNSIEIILAHTIAPKILYNSIKKWNDQTILTKSNPITHHWPVNIIIEGNLLQPSNNHLSLYESNIAFIPGVYSSPNIKNGGQIGYHLIYFNDSKDPKKGIRKIVDSLINISNFQFTNNYKISNKIESLTNRYKSIARQNVSDARFINFPQIESLASENPNIQVVADAMKRTADCDIAMINSPVIRSCFTEKLTYEKLFSIFPFPNKVVTVELTGSEIKSLFSINTISFHHSTIVPSFNLTQVIDQHHFFNNFDLFIDNVKLKENYLYKVAMTDFLFQGGDGVSIYGFNPSEYIKLMKRNYSYSCNSLRDVLIKDAQKQKLYFPSKSFRIHRLGRLSFEKKINDLLNMGYRLEMLGENASATQYYFKAFALSPDNVEVRYYLTRNLVDILVNNETINNDIYKIWEVKKILGELIPNFIFNEKPELDISLALTFKFSNDNKRDQIYSIIPVNDMTMFNFMYLAEQLICRSSTSKNDTLFNNDINWARQIISLVQSKVNQNHSFELYNHWVKNLNIAIQYCIDIRYKNDIKKNLLKTLNNLVLMPTYIGESLSLLRLFYFEKGSINQEKWLESLDDKIETIIKLNPEDPLKIINIVEN